jgi:hypothetical protein
MGTQDRELRFAYRGRVYGATTMRADGPPPPAYPITLVAYDEDGQEVAASGPLVRAASRGEAFGQIVDAIDAEPPAGGA